jgi:hypothetical protein
LTKAARGNRIEIAIASGTLRDIDKLSKMPSSKRRKLFYLQIEWLGDAEAPESEKRV